MNYLSFGMQVFLKRLMVTETSCSRSHPLRLSTFREDVLASIFAADLSFKKEHERKKKVKKKRS